MHSNKIQLITKTTTAATTKTFLCYKCQRILDKPIYLLCNHKYCLHCFNEIIQSSTASIENTANNCPNCHRTFNVNWMRSAIKTSTASASSLVDQKLTSCLQKESTVNNCLNNKCASNSNQTVNTTETDDHSSLTSSRQLNSSNSIDEEMTHFKPIRLMPMSGKNICVKILKIPCFRLSFSKEKENIFSPVKSKFKPEVKLKLRRSAFCLVSPPKPKVCAKSNKTIQQKKSKQQQQQQQQQKQQQQPDHQQEQNTRVTRTQKMYSCLLNGNQSNSKRTRLNAKCNNANGATRKTKTINENNESSGKSNKLLEERRDYRLNNTVVEYKHNKKNNQLLQSQQQLQPSQNDVDLQSHSSDSPLKTKRYFLRARSRPHYFPQSTNNNDGNMKNIKSLTSSSALVTTKAIKNGKINKRVVKK